MTRNTYGWFGLLFFLSSCGYHVDDRVTEHFQDYVAAKDLLLDNFSKIDARNYSRWDSINRLEYNVIFACNQYSFKNTIIPQSFELEELLTLWDDDKVVKSLVLVGDSAVKFTVKSTIGVFSGIQETLLFYPKGASDRYEPSYSEVLFESNIKNQWKYVVV